MFSKTVLASVAAALTLAIRLRSLPGGLPSQLKKRAPLLDAGQRQELAARHALGLELPDYSRFLAPDRYTDPAYLEVLDRMSDQGQL